MRYCLHLVIVAFALIASGCDQGADADRQATPTVTPAMKFDATHGGKTVTPHGMVVEGSARDMEDGAVQYQTEDGSTWQVNPQANGTYGTPEEVE